VLDYLEDEFFFRQISTVKISYDDEAVAMKSFYLQSNLFYFSVKKVMIIFDRIDVTVTSLSEVIIEGFHGRYKEAEIYFQIVNNFTKRLSCKGDKN